MKKFFAIILVMLTCVCVPAVSSAECPPEVESLIEGMNKSGELKASYNGKSIVAEVYVDAETAEILDTAGVDIIADYFKQGFKQDLDQNDLEVLKNVFEIYNTNIEFVFKTPSGKRYSVLITAADIAN